MEGWKFMGDKVGTDGYFRLDAWMDEYTYQIVVRSTPNADELAAYEAELS